MSIPDLIPHQPDTDYFFLGNGRIMTAIQWSRQPGDSPYGIILCDPERMSRKHGSLLFHPEFGLARTMLTVTIGGMRHAPRHEDVRVEWSLNRVHAVVVHWRAGAITVTERFTISPGTSTLVRDVMLRTDEPVAAAEEGSLAGVRVEAALYANPLFFDEFGTREHGELYASGYATVKLYPVPSGRAFERFVTVDVAFVGGAARCAFVHALEAVGTHEFSLYPDNHGRLESDRPVAEPIDSTPHAGHEAASGGQPGGTDEDVPELGARIARQYAIARSSLRATVSALGKFDAAIWQYDYEWGLDAAMVATAAALSGQYDLARAVLTNIMRRLSNERGMIAEASRFRDGELAELNGNGAVLDALWHYWRFSDDLAFLHAHRERIGAIADYLLDERFQHPSGLLRTRRDFWERTPWMGVGDGFELGHQVFGAVGLERAAEMARVLGNPADGDRWHAAAERIRTAMLDDPTVPLVDDGRFIRRRLVDGSVQRTMTSDAAYADTDFAPYVPPPGNEPPDTRPCEPDVTEVLPIVYRLVHARDQRAQRTLDALETLWNPTGIGGYARYNILSEPDSPGPWPFASAFMAGALLDAGRIEDARKTIEWLLDVAGPGGSWFEYYGERRTPPFPPVGVIVWGWAQFVVLVTRHMAGVRIEGDDIVISPGLPGIEHRVWVGHHEVHIIVRPTAATGEDAAGTARLDGAPVAPSAGAVRLRLPLTANHVVEFG